MNRTSIQCPSCNRQIKEAQCKILDDFFMAYGAQLMHLGKDISLDDICLIEQEPHFRDGCVTRRYWYEFKPIFKEDE